MILLAACEKEEGQSYPTFLATMRVEPETDTLGPGDTLWIKGELSAYFIDSATLEKQYFSDAYIRLNVLVRAWNEHNQDYPPYNYTFVYSTPVAYVSQTSRASMLGMLYRNSDHLYHFNLGVVFKRPGIYSIDTDFFYADELNESKAFGGGLVYYYDMSGDYHEALLSASIGNTQNNFELYQSLSDEQKASFREVGEANKHKYYFIHVAD
jgi:hypothetical protein